MRKLFYLAIFTMFGIFLVVSVTAQSYHFIYLQSENRKPFYVKIERQLMKSSASGYCILPKLISGNYGLTIGFIHGDVPEQVFDCTVNNKDVGFLIKKAGEKRWALFNLQTMETLEATNNKQADPAAPTTKADEFSALLSTVVNDPTIRQAEQQSPKAATVPAQQATGRQPSVAEQQSVTAVHPTPVQSEEKKPVISSIRKLDAINSGQLLRLKYQDQTDVFTDTIEVILELEAPTLAEKPKEENLVKAQPDSLSSGSVVDQPLIVPDAKVSVPADSLVPPSVAAKANDRQDLPMEVKTAISEDTVLSRQLSAKPMINSNCRLYATEDDFLKLRKKMAAAENDEDMLAAARKVFKTICFSTAQIRNLGVLFLKDDGRYRFFDLAYPFAADSHRYAELEKQLSDSYYINRFRAMVRH